MNICVFKTADVKRCVQHALNAKSWRMGSMPETAANPPGPGLFIVHDDGVYLMSNGEPGDTLPGTISLYVAYAEGCDPNKDEDCWDNSRLLVGGDDFGEVIRITEEWLKNCEENEELHIAVTPTKFLSRFTKPRKAVAT